jgi:hypothetical protein
MSSSSQGRCWTTVITTSDYVEGVVCLAKSLELVRSCVPLICYVTSEDVSLAFSLDRPANLIVEIIDLSLSDPIFDEDVLKDKALFIDAPRRFLFKAGKPFVFLDADMIAVRNFDELLDLLNLDSLGIGSIWAVPNFRNKKKNYGDASGIV